MPPDRLPAIRYFLRGLNIFFVIAITWCSVGV